MTIACPIIVTVTAPTQPPTPTATPAAITALEIPATFAPNASYVYTPGMQVTVGVTWKNTGGTVGTFVPSLLVNNQPVYSSSSGTTPVTLQPGETAIVLFNVPIGGAGRFDICPSPN